MHGALQVLKHAPSGLSQTWVTQIEGAAGGSFSLTDEVLDLMCYPVQQVGACVRLVFA